MSLPAILDKLWQAPPPRYDVAKRLLPSLTDEEVRDIAQKLIVATSNGSLACEPLGQNGLRLTAKGMRASSEAYVSRTLTPGALMHFTDVGASLVAVDPTFVSFWGETRKYRIAQVLVAMQWARDHVDSLLFHPNDLRSSEFAQMAKEFEMSIDLLRKLAPSAK